MEKQMQRFLILDRFCHISDLTAVHLKLTPTQMVLLNTFIQNYIRGTLEPYNPDDQNNKLFLFPIYSLAKRFNIPLQSLYYAMSSLRKIRRELGGVEFSMLLVKKNIRGLYIGMYKEMIWDLVKDCPYMYNSQCADAGRCDLIFRGMKKKQLPEPEQMKNITGETSIIKDNMKALIELPEPEKKKSDIKQITNYIPDWTELLVKEICLMAKQENAQIDGRAVFPHLDKENNFKKQRKGIDNACQYIQEIYKGTFLINHKGLFESLPDSVKELKKVDKVMKRVAMLRGDKELIKTFLLRCVENYFKALQPGMDTYYSIKKSFPTSIKNFLLFVSCDGKLTANFMLYYFGNIKATEQAGHDICVKIQKKYPDIYNTLENIADHVRGYNEQAKVYQAYWLNANRLIKYFNELKEDELTSYSLASCFDFVIDNLQKRIDGIGHLEAGMLGLDSVTIRSALKEIKDK